MEQLSLAQVVTAVHGRILGEWDPDILISEICTDSRRVPQNSLFLPLVGEKFDGHDYIDSALNSGAAACITAKDDIEQLKGKYYIKVENTQDALRDLAVFYRNLFDIPVVAITGSVGKTTTKDMIAAVLSEKYHVLKTEGNFNNNIGLPMTIFRLDHTHEIAVLEMGMNHLGEIDYLTRIACPNVAVITNIGDAHIENLGCRENTLRAKAEIFHGMKDAGIAVLNGDDVLLQSLEGNISQRIIWCGKKTENDWHAFDVKEDWQDHMVCTIANEETNWEQLIPALGAHMIYPVTMAAAVGHIFGLTDAQIKRGIESFSPTKMRMAILKCADDIIVLNDTYNANPQSMRAGLEILSKQNASKKIAILGDMLELGDRGPTLHTEIGVAAGTLGIDCVITIGKLGRYIAEGALSAGVTEVSAFESMDEAAQEIEKTLVSGASVLLKASRGMKFERLVEYICKIKPETDA